MDGDWIPATPGSYPLRPGNALSYWVDGIPFFSRLEEAYGQARRSAWATVSFVSPAFRFPSGRTLWDVLDETAARGVDTRLLFWRNADFGTDNIVLGDAEDRARFVERGSLWKARWDDSAPDRAHCHHQKSWVFDSGEASELAMIGGMVFGLQTVDDARHQRLPRSVHDIVAELRGPASADAAHNFVQRWNEARVSGEAGPWPSAARADDLPFPTRAAEGRGPASVLVTRTVQAGRYADQTPSPGGAPYAIADGEDSVWRQYRAAFDAARSSIYIESQHPGERALLEALGRALARGVEVFYLVPGEPMAAIAQARAESRRRGMEAPYAATFAALDALAGHPGMTLARLAIADEDSGRHREVYVHSKLAIVDGAWLTCGSANLVDLSLARDHTELNLCAWDAAGALGLLRRLAEEHGERSFADASAAEIVAALAALARANAAREGPPYDGRLFALDPAGYP